MRERDPYWGPSSCIGTMMMSLRGGGNASKNSYISWAISSPPPPLGVGGRAGQSSGPPPPPPFQPPPSSSPRSRLSVLSSFTAKARMRMQAQPQRRRNIN
jgi:hypothetical protein